MSESIPVLLTALRGFGFGLCETYPYAAQLGRYLRSDQPDWWLRFETTEPELATLPLAQAREFAFLEFCESQVDWAKELDKHLVRYFTDGQRYLGSELANTVTWYRKLKSEAGW
jgi:hypothetical protein